jgi:PadR family transcriptional regulator PadR
VGATNYDSELLKGSTDCLVLTILCDAPTYGYDIIRQLKARSNGYFEFREGTLYPALHRMEKDGLVEGRWEALPGGQERRYYYLTQRGAEALARRRNTWTEFCAAVRAVLTTESD